MAENVESILRELGLDYKITGDEAIAPCPAHKDKHPSWSINTKSLVHHCFSCGFSGNLASLVSHVLNLSYPQAVIWCNSKVGWARAEQWLEDYDSVAFSPQYLKLGEADLALFTAPPDEAMKSKDINAESVKDYGVLWNPKKEEWIFPIRDPFTSQLWGWQSKNARTFRHYPVGCPRSKTLFGLDTFEYGSPVILVESPIDCLRISTAGRRGGLSSLGVRVSDFQFSLIQRCTESLILALDNDSPGVEETARICTEFNGVRNVRIFNYELVNAKDPGEMTDGEIRYGIEHAAPKLKWIHAYKNTRPIPDSPKKQVHWTKELISRLYNGIR